MNAEADEKLIVQALLRKLRCPATSLSEKYRILFSLRNLKGAPSRLALVECLTDTSALFRHEVAYCLGQRCDPAAIDTLSGIMKNPAEHPMVRHEAGEALGAIGTDACIAELRRHQDDACLEVAQTCQLAIQRINFYNSEESAAYKDESRYLSVDPAPAYPFATPFAQLESCLLNESAAIFDRYRALFALRNLGGSAAIRALGLSFQSESALLKHEVAYVLGQMQDKQAVATLSKTGGSMFQRITQLSKQPSYCRDVLTNPGEDAMVRHEAAEALGSIADHVCIGLLKEYSADSEAIVADSCVVALDMLEHELSNSFQYAAGVEQSENILPANFTTPQQQQQAA